MDRYDMCLSDLRDLVYDVDDIKERLSKLELVDLIRGRLEGFEEQYFFLIGYKIVSGRRTRGLIATFTSKTKAEAFIQSCELKIKGQGRRFKKHSPLDEYSSVEIETTYFPENIPLDPTIKDFK